MVPSGDSQPSAMDPTPDEASQKLRYQGGYWGNPGNAYSSYNFLLLRPSDYHPGSPVAIRRPPTTMWQ